MAFNPGDIVKKISGTQQYVILTVLPNSKYACKLHPQQSSVKFTFNETDLVLVPQ